MRFASILIIITALVYVMSANQRLCVNATEDKILAELTLGIRQFSKNFMKHFRESQNGNYVVSPLSLNLALGMINFGTGGSTSFELHKALGTDHIKDDLLEVYKVLSETLSNIYSNLQLDQKIWLPNNFTPKPDFVSKLKKGFKNAGIGDLNFVNTQTAMEIPNLWSQTLSGGNFSNLTQLGEIYRENLLSISSTLNFKGVLGDRLKVKYVLSRKFYIDENVFKDVSMVHANGPVIYGLLPEIGSSFIKYNFLANELSMIIIRSDEIKNFMRLEQQLEDINISMILDRGNLVNMSLFLPKFKLEKTLDLKEIVQKMGIFHIFEASANFSGMSDQELKVDRIMQKISVNINEVGVAAASPSNIRHLKRIYGRDTESFDVNIPFYFVVLHEQTNLPLIRGRIINPLST